MPTYMGNIGHLMQHWTLCKLLTIAAHKDKCIPGLNFIDAHAMAPWATRTRSTNRRFNRVRNRLSPNSQSAYERAWHDLAQGHSEQGYPNSAAFVERVWKSKFSLLLCEIYPPTVEVIERWCERYGTPQRRQTAEVFEGDWRKRFRQGLPHPCAVGLEKESLTYISFDPYKYDSRPSAQAAPDGDLYPEDMELMVSKLSELEGQVLIQISTYSNANGRNPHVNVIASLDPILGAAGFTRPCEPVEVDDGMMSLVYSHNVLWMGELGKLPSNFRKWIEAVTK